MSASSWKSIAELIGVLTIVLSLVFVGFQLQQDRAIAEAQLVTDSEIKQIELSGLVAANSAVWVKGLRGEELSPEEEAAFETIVHSITVKYDSMWERSQRNLSTRTSGIPRQLALHVHANPGFRRAWERRCRYYKGISGEEIPPCVRVKEQLALIESGNAAPPDTYMWSL